MNESGIYPMGDRVLIRPDEVKYEGTIVIPETEQEKYANAQSIGVLIAVGPDAWIDHVDRDKDGQIKTVRGFKSHFAKPGDRIAFAKYGGIQMKGKDGVDYRLMNDTDVTAKVDKEIDATNLVARKAFT